MLTNLIFYLRYYLSSIKFDLEHTKDKWDAIIASIILSSFEMMNIVMILYEQLLRLDLA